MRYSQSTLTGDMRQAVVGGESFLENSHLGVVSTALQAPCFQPLGGLTPLSDLSFLQLALIYSPKAHGTWGENGSLVPLLSGGC